MSSYYVTRAANTSAPKTARQLAQTFLRSRALLGVGSDGVNFGARQILAVKSVLIPREWVKPEIVVERVSGGSVSMTSAMPVRATRATRGFWCK